MLALAVLTNVAPVTGLGQDRHTIGFYEKGLKPRLGLHAPRNEASTNKDASKKFLLYRKRRKK